MKIMIDISEEKFQAINDNKCNDTLYEEVKNGKIIPNKSGRLIDASWLKIAVWNHKKLHKPWDENEVIKYIENAPTIIEEDVKSEIN